MNESELIAACRRGDRGAQREFYELHADRVYRVALRLTRDEQDAFDVAQDTFLRAFEKIHSFDGRSRLGTWLYRIATNEALQLFRRRDAERRRLRVVSEQRQLTTLPESETTRQEVDDALAVLSAEYRAVLILRYQEGLSYGELAEVLEIAPGTVASRLNRARAELRRLLETAGASASVEEAAGERHPIDGQAPDVRSESESAPPRQVER